MKDARLVVGYENTNVTADLDYSKFAGAFFLNAEKKTALDVDASVDWKKDFAAGNGALDVDYFNKKELTVAGAALYKTLDLNVDYSHTALGVDLGIGSLSYKGRMQFDEASGEFVVVDGSALNYAENYGVNIGSGAQNNIKAANVVNAAASLVGIGINAARMPVGISDVNFNQCNMIVQH